MICLDSKNDLVKLEGSKDDLICELVGVAKIIQQYFVETNENEKFKDFVIRSILDDELSEETREYMKKHKRGEKNDKSTS